MRGWIALLCGTALGCAPGPPPYAPVSPAVGSQLYVIEAADGARRLLVVDGDGARHVPGVAPREARWIDPEHLLVVEELPPEDDFGLPRTRLRIVDREGRSIARIGAPGRHHDAEPSPDGAWLAVGAETGDTGDSDLEIYALAPPYPRVAARHQSLEEPRWRHDGRALAVAVLMADPETDDDSGGQMLGTAFAWPRLHTLRRDLGDPVFVWDGAEPNALAPGGSLPLWWDRDGIFARQRGGLVRCDPQRGGCEAVFSPEPSHRVVDGRRTGADQALLLLAEARDAFDRRQPDACVRVDLRSGRELGRLPAPDGGAILDLDWIAPSALANPSPRARPWGGRAASVQRRSNAGAAGSGFGSGLGSGISIALPAASGASGSPGSPSEIASSWAGS